MIGKTISHYKILEKIGEGGMGVVYKAEDTKLERNVALKFLPSEFTRDTTAKERFIQEAKAASTLEHTNICNIHEIDETKDGQLFIVMACYEGESLKSKIERSPLRLEEALDIAIQVAQGLAKAHEKGIVHRDIKPANVHITNDGVAKILDFGLAKLGDRSKLTKEGTTLGTVAYMSPEQARGEEVDSRTDIWSLGIVLYEMITGQIPFKGEYEQAIVYSIINESPDPMTGLRTGVPMELERITNKALAKNPDERYHIVEDMLVDLKKMKADLDSSGKMVPSKETKKTPGKKFLNRIVMAVGILLVLVLAFFIFKLTIFEDALGSASVPIAVIPFENRTGDEKFDNLGEMIQDLLITKLGNSKYLYVMTRERMNDLLKQMGKHGAIINKELGFELCRQDGVETVVVGSVNKAGDLFVTDVKVLDVESKKMLKSATAQGQGVASILASQIDELGEKISRGVGLTVRKIAANQKPIAEMTTTSTKAYQYYVKGKFEWDNTNYEDARVLLEKAVQLDSTFAMAQLYLGFSYSSLRNSDGERQAFERAKAFSQEAPKKERIFIEAMYEWDINRNREKAFQIFKQMVKEYPKEKWPHFYLAQDYRNKKMYSEAISEFKKALELDQHFGWAYDNLSTTYFKMGDYENAVYYLKLFATADPGNAYPIDELGDLYLITGQLDDAMKCYQEAVTILPEFRSNWKIAYIYALREDYIEAKKWIDNYILKARSPGVKGEGYWWRAFYNLWRGKINQSLRELNQLKGILKDFGGDDIRADLDWTIAWFYYDKGDFENSYKTFQDWADFTLSKNSIRDCFQRGMVDLAVGRIDSAASRFAIMEQLLSDRYNNLWHNYFYAELLLTQDSLEKAISFRTTIGHHNLPGVSLNTMAIYSVPFLKDVYARVYHKKGEIDKAITEYERLITFDPESPERFLIHPKYHYRLAKLYEEKGDTQKAIKEYEKFLDIWKDADEDLPELIDAKERYVKLVSAN